MQDNPFPPSASAAVLASLSEARARVAVGKTQAANAHTNRLAAQIHDRFLVNGIVMLTDTMRKYPADPVLNLQRAAWTIERPKFYEQRLTEEDRLLNIKLDLRSFNDKATNSYDVRMGSAEDAEAFLIVMHFLERHDLSNDALQLLDVAEGAQIQGGHDQACLDLIRQHQQRILTTQMDRIDDQLSPNAINPALLPPSLPSLVRIRPKARVRHG